MKEIFVYPLFITVLVYALGYGLAVFFAPRKIGSLAVWLAPWYTIVALSVGLTTLSLAGISIARSAVAVTIFLLGISAKAWFWDERKLHPGKRDLVLAAVVGISILINLAPLWKNDKILTTVSLGNNDAIIYATVPEYLQEQTIFSRLLFSGHEGEYDYNGISNLIRIGYRWGSPVTLAYFLEVTGLRGYQLTYLFQVLLFAWMLPLPYTLLVVLRGKESRLGLLLTCGLTAANANLLYMLYHNFAGQVFYWGLSLLFWIQTLACLPEAKRKFTKLTTSDWVVGAIIASVFYTYHEGAVFLLAPLSLWLLVSRNWQVLWRIAVAAQLLSAVAIAHSLMFDVQQAQLVNGPIGWELFRATNPFANPIEALGLWNIHASPTLSQSISVGGSVLILGILGVGIRTTIGQILTIGMAIFYLVMIVWTTWGHHNFFAYNRVLTYILPILIVWFAAGWLRIVDRRRTVGWALGIIILIASLVSGEKLIRRFTYNHITVDRSLMSLTELADNKTIDEPIYLSEVVEGMGYYWRQIWTEYFLYPQKELVSTANLQKFQDCIVPEDALILVSKEPWYHPPRFLWQELVWENGFYQLGRRCLSVDCLLTHAAELQAVEIGKTLYDDTILLDGWSTPENDHRWATEAQASLRWVVGELVPQNKLSLTATTFIPGQVMEVYVDGKLARSVNVTEEWQTYDIALPNVDRGVHQVSLRFARLRQPDPASGDTRELAVDFRRITFETK